MKQIFEFNPEDPFVTGPGTKFSNFGILSYKFNLSTPAGSLFKCRIHNQSPVNLTVRFGDTKGSNDFLPAYKSKYYEMTISQSVIAFGVCGTFLPNVNFSNQFVNSIQDVVKVIQYDPDETVFDTLEHDLVPPQIVASNVDTYQIQQSTTVEFSIPGNLAPVTPLSAPSGFVVVPTGFDISCRPVTTTQKLVVHLNNWFTGATIENYEWQQLTTDNLREYVRFPQSFLEWASAPGNDYTQGYNQYSIKVFALAFGLQQVDLNIYYSAYPGSRLALPTLS